MGVNLNATSGIVTRGELINKLNGMYGAGNGKGILNPEYFYQKQLLDTIRLDADQYVYYRLADTTPIQGKADKLIVRRWAPLQAHTEPLVEGIPPQSDKGSVEKYEIAAAQYGRYMEFSDHVDFKMVDPVIAFYTQEYALVAMETLDLLAKEALFSIANLQFAGGATGYKDIASKENTEAGTCKPTMNDLRKVVLNMKKHLVKPRNNGRFHVIASPEFYFDMISDPTVEKYMTYNQTTKTMYDNSKLVPMFEMEFYEALTVPTTGEFFDANGNRCLLIKNNGEAISAVSGSTAGLASGKIGYITSATTDTAAVKTGAYTTESGYVTDPRTGMQASYIPNKGKWNIPEGCVEYKVQHVLVVGKEALVRTGLAGEDNAKMYVKQKGSAGVLDPIDQRQSIGFKINSVGFGSTRLEAVLDYICVPTELNV